MNNAGQHVLFDAYFDRVIADDKIASECKSAITHCGLHVVASMRKDFEPHGMTAIWLLEESHFSVHTFPEQNYISVDCYTCGNEGNPIRAIDYLVKTLQPVRHNIQILERK
jgi:S-adenosylmethionine decarboxylase